MKKSIVTGVSVLFYSIALAQSDNNNAEVIQASSFHISKPLSELFEESLNKNQENKTKTESGDRAHRSV